MVSPSGDRSSEIHVPSSVVKSKVRVGMSGSELVRRASAAELSFCSVVCAVAGWGCTAAASRTVRAAKTARAVAAVWAVTGWREVMAAPG